MTASTPPTPPTQPDAGTPTPKPANDGFPVRSSDYREGFADGLRAQSLIDSTQLAAMTAERDAANRIKSAEKLILLKEIEDHTAAKATIATLRQQNEALRRDAERLDWCDKHNPYKWADSYRGQTYRAKIDAARAAQQAEGKEPNLGSTPARGAINVGTKGEAPGSLIDG